MSCATWAVGVTTRLWSTVHGFKDDGRPINLIARGSCARVLRRALQQLLPLDRAAVVGDWPRQKAALTLILAVGRLVLGYGRLERGGGEHSFHNAAGGSHMRQPLVCVLLLSALVRVSLRLCLQQRLLAHKP
jgi:hypothetical protein